MSAASVTVSTAPHQGAGAGSTPSAALQQLQVRPISFAVAKALIVLYHSLPGGACLAFGVFLGPRLLGALTLGVGPLNAYRLVELAAPADCLILTRLWLSDELPKNSESRVLGVVLRSLKRDTTIKFLVSYADPSQGHRGTIYQATGWTYTGLSQATPLYDLGDGKARHSRSVSHAFGAHSTHHFSQHGVSVRLAPQEAKHRYVFFIDPVWKVRLKVSVAPYPKGEASDGDR